MNDKIYTPLQAAKVIKKSKSTIYRYIHDGTIPAIKVSEGSYIIYQSAIDEYLEQQKQDTKNQKEPA